ncbi:CBS domain-containing protein [bacterium]|nr:MAG: CBS domain-containing protein [bacterium]
MNASLIKSKVGSLDPKKPFYLSADASVKDAVKSMKEHQMGCVLIKDGEKWAGILTERDVLRSLSRNVDLRNIKVAELMDDDPNYLYDDDSAAYALNEMSVGGHRSLSVLGKDNKPNGILTIEHILDHIIDRLNF